MLRARTCNFLRITQITRETSSILMTSDLHLTLALFLIAVTPRPKGIMPFTFNPILTCHSRTIGPTCRFTKAPAIRKRARIRLRFLSRTNIEFRNEALHCGRTNQRITCGRCNFDLISSRCDEPASKDISSSCS